jgi:hypothetical protein
VLADIAQARQDRLKRISDSVAAKAGALWRRGMTTDFDASWGRISPQLVAAVSAAQLKGASGSQGYLNQVAGGAAEDDGLVEAAVFVGIDGSGRELSGLLYGAVTTAKTLVGAGSGVQAALAGGGSYLDTMTKTAVDDIGRSSDLTAATSRSYTHYVRVVSSGACSRCAILAGTGSYKEAFLRHPRCRCTAVPVTDLDKSPARLFSSPAHYFEGLSKAEQDRVFTNAGAEAIRAGADPITVVSARRGAVGIDYSRGSKAALQSSRRIQRSVIGRDRDGKPVLGYTTGEGTTRRGSFSRQNRTATGTYNKRVRLMPETIVSLTDDVELRRILLRDAGYLRYSTSGTTQEWIARQAEQIRTDRAAADAFYRSRGIRVG